LPGTSKHTALTALLSLYHATGEKNPALLKKIIEGNPLAQTDIIKYWQQLSELEKEATTDKVNEFIKFAPTIDKDLSLEHKFQKMIDRAEQLEMKIMAKGLRNLQEKGEKLRKELADGDITKAEFDTKHAKLLKSLKQSKVIAIIEAMISGNQAAANDQAAEAVDDLREEQKEAEEEKERESEDDEEEEAVEAPKTPKTPEQLDTIISNIIASESNSKLKKIMRNEEYRKIMQMTAGNERVPIITRYGNSQTTKDEKDIMNNAIRQSLKGAEYYRMLDWNGKFTEIPVKVYENDGDGHKPGDPNLTEIIDKLNKSFLKTFNNPNPKVKKDKRNSAAYDLPSRTLIPLGLVGRFSDKYLKKIHKSPQTFNPVSSLNSLPNPNDRPIAPVNLNPQFEEASSALIPEQLRRSRRRSSVIEDRVDTSAFKRIAEEAQAQAQSGQGKKKNKQTGKKRFVIKLV